MSQKEIETLIEESNKNNAETTSSAEYNPDQRIIDNVNDEQRDMWLRKPYSGFDMKTGKYIGK